VHAQRNARPAARRAAPPDREEIATSRSTLLARSTIKKGARARAKGRAESEDAMGTTLKKTDTLREIEQAFGQVPKWIDQLPETALGGFWGLFRDFYLAETLIPNKYKELIGLAVSGATRCRYCVLFHTEAARLHGATDAEIAEASMMGGVTMCGSTFLNAQGVDYEQFRRETKEIVAYVKQRGAKQERKAPVAHA
jgi:AhpD family alkylhydroperoxidase